MTKIDNQCRIKCKSAVGIKIETLAIPGPKEMSNPLRAVGLACLSLALSRHPLKALAILSGSSPNPLGRQAGRQSTTCVGSGKFQIQRVGQVRMSGGSHRVGD